MPPRIRKVAVGLGNPGSQYQLTRHNLGFLAVDRYLERSRRKPERLECNTAILYRKGEILLAKPTTYMNRSGVAVSQIMEIFSVNPQECLIIYDDYALPFGALRARPRGGPGGHHGMESIITVLGTEEIPRLRLGIAAGLPLEDLTDHVLSEFTREEERVLDEFLTRAAEAIDCFLRRDIQAVMNQFNA
ncbi:MAG: aminoacyl-tRNA hydrolase [Candidatus Fraserbacteria bacterium RBG_16_55_9]|uniref:Peptidyl-tRNA hydrolase n=1 Tax=Fraserbacteria sp. (strain RBG_16_55_9) TaxID=1817864 RepID=A0A1F5UYA7_FRAXR|nr:MAG: aminoacyl-tRNA hydrolase [Candidatus Fraserbacteria bacterium RBG_16_55_9]